MIPPAVTTIQEIALITGWILPSAGKAYFRPDHVDDYINRLGNMTLLNTKTNEDIANCNFADKKRLALDTSELPINKYFRTVSEWKAAVIGRRQEKLSKIALEVWDM